MRVFTVFDGVSVSLCVGAGQGRAGQGREGRGGEDWKKRLNPLN